MTTTNSQPSTAKRRRLSAAGTLLTVAAAIAVGVLGPATTAYADTTTPLPPPGRSKWPTRWRPGGPPAERPRPVCRHRLLA
jgi:hypothetical protein